MSYPTPGEYQEALQFPSIALLDPDLQDAEPETNALGLPRAITGAFAVVFPVRTRTARWALKCFLTDVPDQRRRYRAIGEHLAGLELPYMAEFVYQRRGIRVGGGVYPILKMEWLDGHGLNAFVAKQIGAGRVDAVAALVPMWRRMMAALEAATIAHGDLQHGNILVDADGLRLVDYDTMFVPGLEGRRSPEVGHRNYQHPDRDERDFGPYLDRFSALLIDTALQACALEPTLWERFDTGENLLFRSDDLLDPGSSALFEELRRLEQLAGQVDLLRHACYMEPEDVPPLHEIVQDASGATRDGRAGAAADGARGRLTSLRKRRQASDAASAERRVFGEPTPFERWAMPLLVGGLALSTLVGFVASWTAALLIVIIVAASWAGAAVWSYRRIPAVRR